MDNNIKLSVLVCSVLERASTFLPKILKQLDAQCSQHHDVEVLLLLDNKTMTLGEKRNEMVRVSSGRYVVFVDDDDRIEPHYVATLLDAINSGVDIITFGVSVSLNGDTPKLCKYSMKYEKDYNTSDAYFRIPNHICCVKRSIAIATPYKPILRGEDAAYAKDLLPKLNSEYVINDVLYHYDFDITTTVTQKKIR